MVFTRSISQIKIGMKIRKLKKNIFVIILLISLPLKSLASPASSNNTEEIVHGHEHEQINLHLWHPQYQERCYFSDRENVRNTNIETIKILLTLLRKEPLISTYLLSFLKKINTVICIDERDDETRGYYDFKYNIIGLKEHLELFEKLIILVHELRHISHFNKGYVNSLDYDIDEIIRMNFAIEADVQAIVTLYAWRMKEIDINEVWNAIHGFEHYFDIAEEFEKEIKRSKDELKATYAAFVQWYKSEWRVDKYYKCSYAWYVDRLDETKLIPKYEKLPETFFTKLCELPNGKNYGCHRSDEIKESPRKIIQEVNKIIETNCLTH
jgi:hypothetical protein